MSSLFVPEEEEYDDKSETLFVPDEDDQERPIETIEDEQDAQNAKEEEYVEPENQPEISFERTRAHYERIMKEAEEGSIPVVREEKAETTAVFESRDINCILPLKFYQEIVETMLSKDGLLILGRGLGCQMITANLLYALSSPSVVLEKGKTKTTKRSLVILLGAGETEIVQLNDLLVELQWLNAVAQNDNSESKYESVLRVVRGSDLANTNKRREMYAKGGVLSISSRILVVDLLSGIVKPSDITGLFVLHAEKIRETSNDSFIVNLYRDDNDWGFVKAVSDDPESFTGFTPLASKLKYLRLSEVFLWPRFHVEVTSSLLLKPSAQKSKRSTVTEINVKLSAKMAKIQTAILSCLTACLQELRRHNPTLDTDYWDIDNLHDNDFVTRVRLSLESQWHRISWTSKQLVYDLATLKELLLGLLRDDSLTFYQRVQGIVDTNLRSSGAGTMNATTMSPWLMMDEGTTITSYAKERALGRVTVASQDSEEGGQTNGSSEKPVVYNLEEQPKWEQLALLVDDIIHERSIDNNKTEGPILIMCSSSRTAQQLSSILAKAKKKVHEPTGRKWFSCKNFMVGKLREYLQWKELISLTKRLTTELANNNEDDSKEGTPDSTGDEKLNTSKSFTRGHNVPRSKRRRTRGAAAVANVARLYSGSDFEKTAGPVDLEQDIVDRLEQDIKQEYDSNDELEEVEIEEEEQEHEEMEEQMENPFANMTTPQIKAAKIDIEHLEKYNQIIIETYNEITNESLLQELCPSYIIMYEPDLSFIRRVEVYHATNYISEPKTFFMYYGTSVEEQTHLMRIRKEKSAFTSLIREKAGLGKRFATESDNWKFHLRKAQVVNTRIAGGAKFRTEEDEMRVIVDSREFRSSLPNLLYRVGIQVIPCMLTVGDYVVSPKICVERKSIPDLIGSFKSGRLYQQCEQMFRHYETPCLLIEFDESKSFSFEPFAEIRPPGFKATNPIASKISKKEIQSKITELLISFPKLKIIWSSSPYETAQIFLELKASQQEPDVEEALSKGVNPAISTSEGPPMFNDDAIDLLQSIPGINNVNYTTVISRVKNIRDLVTLPKDELKAMLGEENGNKAYNFMNRVVR